MRAPTRHPPASDVALLGDGDGVPAPPLLAHLALALKPGQHAVEVVLLDPHLLGDLGDGDAGSALHELERLVSTGARATRPAAPATGRTRGVTGRPRLRRVRVVLPSARRTLRLDVAPAVALQDLVGLLELVVLLDERLELLEPLGDLSLRLLQEVRQVSLLSFGFARSLSFITYFKNNYNSPTDSNS